MSKYEDALKQGLTDDDITGLFQPKIQTALTQMGEKDTQVFLSTQMGLPEHIVNKLLGKQVPQQIQTPEDLSPEAKAAPTMPTQPAQEPSMLEKVTSNVVGFGKEVVNTASSMLNQATPSLEQGVGAVAGVAGEAVRASEKTMEFLTGTPTVTLKEAGVANADTTLGQTLQKYSDDMDQQWEKQYGKKVNLPKLMTDIVGGLALPAVTTEKALVTSWGALKNIINPQNAKSVLTSVALTDAQLRRDNVPNAEAWAAGFGAFQAVVPLVSAGIDIRTVSKANAYIDDVLRIKPEDYERELSAISRSIDISGLSEFEKRVLVASKVSPQAAANLEKVILSNDKYASAVYQQLVNKTNSTENITQAETSSLSMAVGDTREQIKSQYGSMSEKIANATKTIEFDMQGVKSTLAGVEDAVTANLLGKEKALSTINKIKNSEPTTYDELAELTSDLGKRIRQLPDSDSAKSGLESIYSGLRNSIETQVGKFASEEGKAVISATIKGQNEAYAFLKQELEKTDIFSSMLFKNMPEDQLNKQLIKAVTSNTNPELTQKFLDTLNRVKQTTNPELVEQGIIKQIIEGSKKKVSDAGQELVDFAKLSSTLDQLPEGLIASPQAKLVVESLQDIASFSKYDLGLAKSITKFGGVEAQQLANQVGSTLGFSLGLKTQQFLAKAGLRLVNDASAYSVAVAKVLDKEKELPVIIGQFKNSFGYSMPKDDLSQLDKYLTQMTDLYNESTITHNASMSQRALTNSEGSYWQRLSNLYSESELKDMFKIKNSTQGVDNLPYMDINKAMNFRWDKVTSTPQDIASISSGFKSMFPNQKIVLGDTTDLTGNVWTIGRQDQFTPGSLSKQMLDLVDGKLVGAKYNLSREIPDVMGQGELQIVSNDIGYHMQKNGLDPELQSTMYQSGNKLTWETPRGTVTLSRTTTPEGNFEWTANTMGFERESGQGGKWYQGVYDWIDSLGPQHSYTATSGLTDINQYRSTINQIKFGLRSGQFSQNINHNQVQTATSGLRADADSRIAGAIEGSSETFDVLSKNITSYIEQMAGNTLGKTVSLAKLSDSEINDIVKAWHETKPRGSYEKSTGTNTLKMMRAIARNSSGTSKGGMENFVNRAEDLLDNMPQPLPPKSEQLVSSSVIDTLSRLSYESSRNNYLVNSLRDGTITSSQAAQLRSQFNIQ